MVVYMNYRVDKAGIENGWMDINDLFTICFLKRNL